MDGRGLKENIMAEPKDLIVPMLREMRAEMRERFDGVDRRLESIESTQRNFRQALSADSMMSKLVTGDFEERIQALEAKVDALVKSRQ
jgi:hypothetical protein